MVNFISEISRKVFIRRFKGQTVSSAALEMSAFFITAFVVWAILRSPYSGVAGENRYLILASVIPVLCGIWYFTQKRSFRVNVSFLMFLPFSAYLGAKAGFHISAMLLLFMFVISNFMRRRMDFFIIYLALFAAGIILTVWGVHEYAVVRLQEINMSMYEYYFSPMIGAKGVGGVDSLAMLLCIVQPFLVSIFLAKRYSNGSRIASIVGFVIAWYGIFAYGNFAALLVSSVSTTCAPFMYVAKERYRNRYALYLGAVSAYVVFAYAWDKYLACDLTSVSMSSLYAPYWEGFVGAFSSLGGISFFGLGEMPQTSVFAVNAALYLGIVGTVLAAAPLLFLCVRALSVWRRTPIEKLGNHGSRLLWQSKDQAFGKIRWREYRFVTTPLDRIVRGSSLAGFLAAVFMSVFGGGVFSEEAMLTFSVVCAVMLFTNFGAKAVKKRFRAAGIFALVLGIAWSLLVLSGYDTHKGLTGRTYYDWSSYYED